ncbi:hypothetical protein SBRCBS47491_008991 [Sporothrix bragantina]|uniref:N-acetylgalactosaminide beta-1,3-galactosyltransferase n=1 Tax=Sporothrix bragantina TaxID=671064 RepID=A0ABP0CR63_9PEZI
MVTPRSRARIWRRLAALAFALALAFYMLPYDNHTRLAIRYVTYTSRQRHLSRKQMLTDSAPYPVDLSTDVALIIKSGYGTKDRFPGTLAFMEDESNSGKVHYGSILLVADFATKPGQHYNCCHGMDLPVHDVVAKTIERAPVGDGKHKPKHVENYARLQDALSANNHTLALDLSREFGWQLDAMKFISSLELAYTTFPDKKWYILADDDTYLIRSSLRQFLGHFCSKEAHYLGNAVGGWEGRFAHGGSGVLISQGAMRRLFKDRPEVVVQMHYEALTTGMGDSLLSHTMMQIGAYVAEEHSLFFSGETPTTTKLKPDRFCLPIMSFHGLRANDATLEVDRVLRKTEDRPPLWQDIWRLYGGPDLASGDMPASRADWDYVGRLDEYTTTIEDVSDEQACLQQCVGSRYESTCLAWTWEAERRVCHLSPWMIVGEKVAGRTTGLNPTRVHKMVKACGP